MNGGVLLVIAGSRPYVNRNILQAHSACYVE